MVSSTQRMEKQKCNDVEEIDFSSIIPKNSSMCDFRQMYLKKQSRALLDSSTDIHKELVCKYQQCNKLLNIYLKREILTKLSRVRYKPSNELWEVKMETTEMNLSPKMKTFLQVISERGFELLQNEDIFDDFAEIDNSSETFVIHKGKLVKICLDMDVICPQNQSQTVLPKTGVNHSAESNPKTLPQNNNGENCTDNTILLPKQTKGILKRSKCFEYCESKASINVIELDDTDSDDEALNEKDDTPELYDILIINFVLSLRKSVLADIVLKQFFSKIVFPEQKNLLLVFHVGPLIKDQELVLYQYISSRDVKHIQGSSMRDKDVVLENQGNLLNEQLPSDDNEVCQTHLNIDPLVKRWLENESKLVHQFSDFTESVKDSIYEYQGLEKLQCPKVKKGKSKKL